MSMFKADNSLSVSDLASALEKYKRELDNYIKNTRLVFERSQSPDKSPPYVLDSLLNVMSSLSAGPSASLDPTNTLHSIKTFLDKKQTVAGIKASNSTEQDNVSNVQLK